MSTRTRGSVRRRLIAIAALVLVITQIPVIRNTAVDIPVIGGVVSRVPAVVELFAGEANGMAVPGQWKSHVENCLPVTIKREKRCGDLPVLPVDANVTPYIAHNVSAAWANGASAMLTLMRSKADANRANALAGRVRNFSNTSLDEYPMATTAEGGRGARVEEVPERENSSQGGTMNTFYYVNKMSDGDQFLVVIINPREIATYAYQG
ncbi:NucA/NucB deoxyribonuclease domain-containing protein [Actinokineospora sp.]|uniref:NucA/NucB deoxyribonuclease domain-containing protein n=1 Tax=Actinokineospora sp. TaxID=1872133 RepID=UPI0040381718